MPMPIGLSHVAMSVPSGTLTDEYRAEVVEFYGGLLGWHEIDSLRLPDRMTLSVGRHTYVNIRERPEVMVCHGYEHLGIVVESPAEVERLWGVLDADAREVNLEPLGAGKDAYRSFRFRYLLPLAIEVQFFP
jgi:catechol 2,3-dioxygenase-like lactoylglutathione lyase family enzyme